jgi:hypothetical protein
VSLGCDAGGTPLVACEEAEAAFRTLILLGYVRRAAMGEGCGCEALRDGVHVEKEAVAADKGAIMAGE